jgi:2-iminobutanoate/2-iminopropanoate deaminase
MNKNVWILSCVLANALSTAAIADSPSKPEFLNSKEALAQARPFSQAVRAGDYMFLSGQLGDRDGKLVPGGLAPEARQALQNIKNILETNGASLADVVKCTVFLADIAEWPAFNEIYKETFKSPYPARSALAASGLALNGRVELECIAYVPRKK